MQTWAKRGLQTALVTGGLLMLGTGIASAQENVNPDAPPNPLDAKVRIPVDVDHNNLGTPIGNGNLPSIHHEVGTPDLSGTPADRYADSANPYVRGAQASLTATDAGGVTRGNTADADVVMPLSICGNAIAAGGDAYSEEHCSQTVDSTGDVKTDGSYGPLSGNVAHGAAAISSQVSGNAIAALANAETRGSADQRATAGGDVKTSGEDGSLSGNIAAVQGAVPVQATNNALAAGGNARSTASASNDADASGSLRTDGSRSTGGGNVLGAPLAPIAAVSGNGVAAAGNADAVTENEASANAGDTHPDRWGTPMWAATSGNNGTLAGNVFQPALAGPVSADDNALAGGGNARMAGTTANDAEAGGNSATSGHDAVLSGNFTDAPVALPVSGAGNALSGVGTTSAAHSNDATATAGGDTFTNGDRSVLSANSANLPPAGAADLCGTGATAGGIAQGECVNDVTADAGGYNGTTGNDAVGSGNIGQVPVGLPAEAFGNGAGAAGTSSGRATEDKTIRSGDVANSVDDNGTVSSNVVTAPTALGGQVFGNSGGAVANPSSKTDSDTKIDLGNPPKANGKHGSVSGNIVHAPTSNPAQVFGDSIVGVGNGSSETNSRLDSRSGGSATTTGDEGSLSGNVLSLPEASSPQVFGSAIGAGGNAESKSRNEFGSHSGGDVQTSGNDGSFSGNGIGAQQSVPLQVFGDAVTAAGNGESQTDNKTAIIAGGEHLTSADDSAWSGNLFTAPTAVAPSAQGDAVTAAGLADSATGSRSDSKSGGKTTTSGYGSATAHDVDVPAEAFARLVGVPLDVLGTATTNSTDDNRLRTGEDKAEDPVRGIQLPAVVDSLMRATELPNLDVLRYLPEYKRLLSTLGLDELRGLPIHGVTGNGLQKVGPPVRDLVTKARKTQFGNPVLAGSQLPEADQPTQLLPALPETPALPDASELVDRSALPHLTDQLPTIDALKQVKQVRHGLPPVTGATRAVARKLPGVSSLSSTVRPDTADERSFGGTLPLVGDLGTTPDLQNLPLNGSPLGVSQGRSLSTLPVAAPAPLPFVVPVPGVAQPRTAAPVMAPVGVSGLDVSPVQDSARPAEVLDHVEAPALAGLDARSVFGSLEDTTVMPRIV
ncbi:beta strand repeat-containing protein [Saccharothrix deserti]|uniref:beta strand repeat-containing protein n=1 Tax=Saccharothrix deserti TaxID=2593674 RepID=UPI00131E5B02|nr:chaplin family protein [Saccharothrix deserti]